MKRLVSGQCAGFAWLVLALLLSSHCIALKGAELFDDIANSPLDAAVEKKLAEFTVKAATFRNRDCLEQLKSTIPKVIETTGADKSITPTLEKAAARAVESGMKEWQDKLAVLLRKYLNQRPEDAVRMISTWPAEMLARYQIVEGLTMPADRSEWKEALAAALSPAQLASWETKVAEARRERERLVSDYLKPSAIQVQEKCSGDMAAEVADLQSVLALPDDRIAPIKDAAKEAANHAVDAWMKSVAQSLATMDDEQLKSITSRGGSSYGEPKEEYRPDNQEVWKQSIGTHLSQSERDRWQASRDERLQRRSQVLAMMLVAELDKKLMLRSSQRDQLLPLMVKLAPRQRAYMSGTSTATNLNLQPSSLLLLAGKAPESEVKAILDKTQWEHWQEACLNRSEVPKDSGASVHMLAAMKTDDTSGPSSLEPLLADFVYRRFSRERERLQDEMKLNVEDIQRSVSAPAEVVRQLEIAAKGAVESTMAPWRDTLENWARSSTKGISPQDFPKRLKSLGSLSFGRNPSLQDNGIWDAAVGELLTPAQRQSWKQQIDERAGYQERVISLSVLVELDRRRRLTREQLTQLEPLMLDVIHRYLPDLSRSFSSGWHLMSYYALVPIRGIDEAVLQKILTPEQWQAFNEQDMARAGDFWSGIKQSHDQRLRSPQGINLSPALRFVE